MVTPLLSMLFNSMEEENSSWVILILSKLDCSTG
jgi:hypothetical protein